MIKFEQEESILTKNEVELLQENVNFVSHGRSITLKLPDGSFLKSEHSIAVNVPDGMDKEKADHFVRIDIKRKIQKDHYKMSQGKI